jgi:hypothetical protein
VWRSTTLSQLHPGRLLCTTGKPAVLTFHWPLACSNLKFARPRPLHARNLKFARTDTARTPARTHMPLVHTVFTFSYYSYGVVTCGQKGEWPRPPLGTQWAPAPGPPADCGRHAQRGLCGYGPGAPGGGLPLSVPASLRVGARLVRLPNIQARFSRSVRAASLAWQRPVARGFASRSTGWAGCVQACASTLEIRAKRGVFHGPDDRQAPTPGRVLASPA